MKLNSKDKNMKTYIKHTILLYVGIFTTVGVAILACDNVDYTELNKFPAIEQLTIADISPTAGDIGTSVSVTGTNFSPVSANNKVTVNGITAIVSSASNTNITFTIPEGTTSGAVVISHGDFTATGPIFSVVDVPVITDVAPSTAAEGETIIISGTKFSTTLTDNVVVVNGQIATVTDVTDTSITTTVPSGSITGVGDVTVTVAGQTGTFSGFIIAPRITAINPSLGEAGTTVTITGTGFSDTPENNIVDFNGIEAIVTAATVTSITTSVPDGATTGPVSITINNVTSEGLEFTIGVPITTLVIPINSEDDDAEEVSEVDPAPDPGDPIPMVGDMDLSSSDLEFGEISSGQGLQNIGLRFNNVAIPPGSTVTEATIQFKCDDDGSDPVEITIYGEAIDNASVFTETNGDISARPLTSASAVWNIAPWLAAGDRTDAQKTVDISNVIQEIVDRPGWVSGNSISIIMKHTGVSLGATSSSTGREAENYSDSTSDDGAELTIVYQ